MAAVTGSVLLSRARGRADMANSTFVSDTDFYRFITEGYQKLHEKLVGCYGSEYSEATAVLSFTTDPLDGVTTSTTDYALPAGFFVLYDVDLGTQVPPRTLKPYMRNERNGLVNSWHQEPRYRIVGKSDGTPVLRILPATTERVLIRYAPEVDPVGGSSVLQIPNGWERYIVVYAAIQALLKEESDVNGLRGELQVMEAELQAIKADRDYQNPQSVVDTEYENYYYPW